MWWHRKKASHVATNALIDGQRMRVIGKAVAVDKNSVGAPYTSRTCLAFKAHIHSYTIGAALGHQLGSESAAVFEVADETGRVRVVGPHWRVEIEEHVVQPNDTVGDPHRAFGLGVLKRHLNPEAELLPSLTHYHEGILQADDVVAVTGLARRTASGWELVSTDHDAVVISTDRRQVER